MLLPSELLDRIAAHILAPSPNNFATIAPVTLVSAQFRQVALRRYFHTLRPRDKIQWGQLWDMLGAQQGGYTWVKCVFLDLDISS